VIERRSRRLLVVLTPLGALVAGCGTSDRSTEAAPGSAAPGSADRCPSAATIADAYVAASHDHTAVRVTNVSCSAGWTAALVDASGNSENTPDSSPVLLRQDGAQWRLVDRAEPCVSGWLPSETHWICDGS
jgi:hypothetical protein